MKSYSSELPGIVPLLREMKSLYQLHAGQAPDYVQARIDDARKVEASVMKRLNMEIRDLDFLEIGPGQFLTQLSYFAARNRVVGIDRDVIARGFQPSAYLRMLQTNGWRRTLKSVARKAAGVDRTYARHLTAALNLPRLPKLTTLAMDVCQMTLPSASFDFVYSRSVLHVLPNAEAALDQIARVLRPGGGAYISIHPYTSATGCLDPRIYTDRRGEVEGWPHLRAERRDGVRGANVFLNEFRIADWERLFEAKMPGAQFVLTRTGNQATIELAQKLQQQGELRQYSLDELLAGELAMLWRKPGA